MRRGDRYVVNGQKIWTTLAHMADWIFCLVRTDPSTERKQEGISFLLIDMSTPGITVRPLILMDGGHEVNEVFFDDVEVPVENRVHDEGKGWTVAKYLLGHERMNTARIGTSKRELEQLKAFAARAAQGRQAAHRRSALPRQAVAARDRADGAGDHQPALSRSSLRGGRAPGAEVSMLKIKGTEIQQALTELMLRSGGADRAGGRARRRPAARRPMLAALAPRYCNMRKTTIYAGSNEIQRNIIAKQALGL